MKEQKTKETVAPQPVKSTLSSVKSDSLVIDFESMLVPGAILIAGLMVSLSIIFSFRGANISNLSANKGTDTTNTDTTDTGTTPDSNDGTVTDVSLDDDPYLGDKSKAKVAIIEFSDYECPFCKRHFQEVFPTLYEKYVKTNQIVYVYRDLPLSFHEPAASLDANAAQCVFDQGGNEMYFQFHDALFGATESNGTNMNASIINGLAKKQKGLDFTKFSKCFTDKKFDKEIKADAADAAKANIQGTPGFIIGKLESDGKTIKNGTFLGGAYPIENFESAIKTYLN